MSKSLNRVIVEEYLKDLRGGKFKQCTRVLHDNNDTHCAVGVFELTYNSFIGKEFHKTLNIYSEFERIVGISNFAVTDRNDGVNPENRRWSFSEIADYIEENSPVMMKEKVG